MRRREFIGLIGGAAAWPLVASTQGQERPYRVGVLVPGVTGDTRYQAWVQVFREALAAEGWNDSKVHLDAHFATDNAASGRGAIGTR